MLVVCRLHIVEGHLVLMTIERAGWVGKGKAS